MATGPKGAVNALDILENGDIFEPSIISKWFNPVMGGVLGFVSICVANYGTRKPIMSGIQKHIGFTIAMFLGIKYWDDAHNRSLAERDAVLRHYVQLHPDDFPPLESKKYKDILERWAPVRT